MIPVVKTEDFSATEDGETAFDNKIVAGKESTITFLGVGMNNNAPKLGDVRYVPASWKLDKEVSWAGAPYTATFMVAAPGNAELVTVYRREFYNGTEWMADGKTMSVSTALTVEAAPVQDDEEATDNEDVTGNDNGQDGESVQTGDNSGYVITIMLMMCMLSAGVILLNTKKKNA